MEMEAELAEVNAEIADIQAQIDAVNADITLTQGQKNSQLKKLNRALDKANETKAELETALLTAQTDEEAARLTAEAARTFANDKQTVATTMQADADALRLSADALLLAAQTTPVTVTSAGNLTLVSGGHIGTLMHGISVAVQGLLNATAGSLSGDSIALAANGDLTVDRITAGGSVLLAGLGSIWGTEGKHRNITADSTRLDALLGSVGDCKHKIRLSTNTLSGMAMGDGASQGNFGIDNDKSLVVGTIYATGTVCMKIKGYLTADAAAAQGSAHIAAAALKLDVSKDIGQTGNPLVINAHNVDIYGKNIDLYCLTHLNVDYMRGRNVNIAARGTVMGGTVYARNLTIAAYGDIGAPDDRFIIYVWGRYSLSSEYGGVWYRNRYKPKVEPEEDVTTDPGGDIPVPGGSGAQMVSPWLWIALLLLLGGLWLVYRRCRERAQG